MTQRGKGKGAAAVQSRHGRDLVLLQRSRTSSTPQEPRGIATPLVAAPLPPAPEPRSPLLNWQADPNEPLLIVRPLQPDELPEVQNPALRALIDATAQGQPLSESLHQALLQLDADAV